METKNYTSAPLPFMGQKRKFVKEIKKVLESYPDDVTIVDLFGGSGGFCRILPNGLNRMQR